MKDPFFIVGVQRSGTTLLSKMLSKHAAIHMEDQARSFRLIGAFDNMFELLPQNLDLSSQEFIKWILDNDKNDKVKEVVDQNILTSEISIRTLIRSSLEKKIADHKKLIWGDKAPNLQFYIRDLLLYVPDAKILHIVRDGRATVASMKKRAYKNITLSADLWLKGNIFGLVNQSILGSDNYHILKYEDLVENPKEVILGVCKFLDIDYDAATIKLDGQSQKESTNYVKSYFDVSRINSWKSDLDSREIEQIESIQGDLLKYYGYDVDNQMVKPLSFRKKAWLTYLDSLKMLFKRRKKGMENWQIIEYNDSFRNRLGKFGMTVVGLVFSKGIYNSLFGHRLFKKRKK